MTPPSPPRRLDAPSTDNVPALAKPEKLRLFVAIFPPPRLLANLQCSVQQLAKILPPRSVRWTPPEQVHLTLAFLGSTPAARLDEIQSVLCAACHAGRRRTVRLAGLGCFPNSRRPRILWAGLAGDMPPLHELQKAIDHAFASIGFPGEDRPFHAHLTFGRVSDLGGAGLRDLAEILSREAQHDFGEWELGRVDLMQSVLSPQGPTYTTLHSITLDAP